MTGTVSCPHAAAGCFSSSWVCLLSSALAAKGARLERRVLLFAESVFR